MNPVRNSAMGDRIRKGNISNGVNRRRDLFDTLLL